MTDCAPKKKPLEIQDIQKRDGITFREASEKWCYETMYPEGRPQYSIIEVKAEK